VDDVQGTAIIKILTYSNLPKIVKNIHLTTTKKIRLHLELADNLDFNIVLNRRFVDGSVGKYFSCYVNGVENRCIFGNSEYRIEVKKPSKICEILISPMQTEEIDTANGWGQTYGLRINEEKFARLENDISTTISIYNDKENKDHGKNSWLYFGIAQNNVSNTTVELYHYAKSPNLSPIPNPQANAMVADSAELVKTLQFDELETFVENDSAISTLVENYNINAKFNEIFDITLLPMGMEISIYRVSHAFLDWEYITINAKMDKSTPLYLLFLDPAVLKYSDDMETDQMTFSGYYGDTQYFNGYSSTYKYSGSRSVRQYLNDGGTSSQDSASIDATSPQISWSYTSGTSSIQVKYYITYMDGPLWAAAWDKGWFGIVARMYDSGGNEVADNNGNKGYTYVLAWQQGQEDGFFSNGPNKMVLSSNGQVTKNTWLSFDRNLNSDYSAMSGKWSQVSYIKISLHTQASGCYENTYEIYWDNIAVYADVPQSGDAYEPDNSFTQYSTMTITSSAQTQSRSIDPAGDNDYIRFYGYGNRKYIFYTTGSTDTFGYLYDNAHTLLTQNDDSGSLNFRMEYTLPSDGYYFLRVCGFSGSTTGSYTLYYSWYQAKWTTMAYMCGDQIQNSLDSHMEEFINKLEKAGSTNDCQIIVQADRDSGAGHWNSCRRYHITYDSSDDGVVRSELVQDMGEQNMGSSQTLMDFVIWARDAYPAEKYFLILCDHGGGWYGICYDDNPGNNDAITNSELKTATSNIKTYIGKNIDVLGLYACEMSMVEVAYAVRGNVDYIVGSEEVAYTNEFPYEGVAKDIKSSPSMSSNSLASDIVNKWYLSEDTSTVSAFRVSDVQNYVVPAISTFASELLEHIYMYPEDINLARYNADHFGLNGASDVFYDIRDFAEQINYFISDSDLNSAATTVISEINYARINQRTNSVHSSVGGMSIYFPSQSISSSYASIDFAVNTQWDEFLDEFTNLNAPPEIELISPVGGETYNWYYMDISWYGRDPNNENVKYDAYISADGGNSWADWLFSETYYETSGWYPHTITVYTGFCPDSTQCIIKIIATDQKGATFQVSSGYFTIDRTPPSVSLTSPRAGRIYINGAELTTTSSTGLTIIVGPITISASASDSCSGVSYVNLAVTSPLGSKSYDDYSYSYSWRFVPDTSCCGECVISAIAYDRAGNSKMSSTISAIIIPTLDAYINSQYYSQEAMNEYQSIEESGGQNES
jgi:hypothetical protein